MLLKTNYVPITSNILIITRKPSYGIFTMHGNGTNNGTESGSNINGF